MVAEYVAANGDEALAAPQRWNWTAIASLITAFTALSALVFTGLSLSTTEQGQFTDRYTKAIDQVGAQGADHLQTRLGGIYALERLARDSPRDQPTIVENLSAFVRSNLPRATVQGNGGSPCPATTNLALDTQAALSVLGRRDHGQDGGAVTDLRATCLA